MTPSVRERWSEFTSCVCQGARLMVGVPDYDTYVEHMRRTHPGAAVMTYPEFFRERQNARYGADGRKGFRLLLRGQPVKQSKSDLTTRSHDVASGQLPIW